MTKSCLGQLVVLKSRWNLYSTRIGIIIEHNAAENKSLVMWTDNSGNNGIKIKHHLYEALLPIAEEVFDEVRRRICDIK